MVFSFLFEISCKCQCGQKRHISLSIIRFDTTPSGHLRANRSSVQVAEAVPTSFDFRTKPGLMNVASCEGVYRLADGDNRLNGKPYFINQGGGRFLAWTGGNCIAANL